MLLIFIPSHNRQLLLLETIKQLDSHYVSIGFSSVKILCIDSSDSRITFPQDFRTKTSLQYEHRPGLNLNEKFLLLAAALKSTKFSWLLLNPDDDVFLPSRVSLEFMGNDRNSGLKFMPSRYLFFRKSVHHASSVGADENFLECWEGWAQQVHIAESSLQMSEKLKNYSMMTGALFWGFFSVGAFLMRCELIESLKPVLGGSRWNLLEDLVNLFTLSLPFAKISKYPICLRNDDRNFNANPGWKPSWVIWAELQAEQKLMQAIASTLAKFLTRVADLTSENPPIIIDQTAAHLITSHVRGYQAANARLFAFGPKLLFRDSRSAGKMNILFPTPYLQYAGKDLPAVLMPDDLSAELCERFPKASLLGDAGAISALYQNRNYMLMSRSR